jgi:hypothetical protein
MSISDDLLPTLDGELSELNKLLDEYCSLLRAIDKDPLNITISLNGKGYRLTEIDASSYITEYRHIKGIEI